MSVRKLETPNWENIISQLENYFFSVGKLFFCSWAFFCGFLGLFLNYFKRFLFILASMYALWSKVKMFDIGQLTVSNDFLRMRVASITKG